MDNAGIIELMLTQSVTNNTPSLVLMCVLSESQCPRRHCVDAIFALQSCVLAGNCKDQII